MSTANAGRSSVRWPTVRTVTGETAVTLPSPLVVSIEGEAGGAYLWSRSPAALNPLPDLDRGTSPSRTALSRDGRVLFFDRYAMREDESIPYVQRFFSRGVFRVELATGEVQRMAYEPRGEYNAIRELASSPDGELVAVAEAWVVDEAKARAQGGLVFRRLSLWIAGIGSPAPRELLTVPGSYRSGPDDSSVHWSPDGRRIALGGITEHIHTRANGSSTRAYTNPSHEYVYELRVVDVGSGEIVLEREGLRTVGTAGWTPDSSRLLVADTEEFIKILHVDTGDLEPLPSFPGSNRGIPFEKSTRILGFLDDRVVMTVAQRGRRMLLSAVDIDTGEVEPLIGCADAPEAMPVLAPMTPDYWRA